MAARLSLLMVLTAALSGAAELRAEPPAALVAGEPTLERATVPAGGRSESLVNLPAPGRYTFLAESGGGVTLRLVDRMTGPGPVAGQAGAKDGRLDLLLEAGQYKLKVRGADRASGEARLSVRRSRELHLPQPPRLVDLKAVETTLEDGEQRSYWLDVAEARTVVVEAAGRDLADLRLWKDGSWLHEVEPTIERLEPLPGRPLTDCRLVARLDRGLYLLTAYAGPALPWTSEAARHPFYVKLGVPGLPTASRRRFTVGPLGRDRWLVPGAATYFRMELPQAVPAELAVGPTDEAASRVDGLRRVAIDKKSRTPVAEVQAEASEAQLVEVRGAPGQPYVLQHFPRSLGLGSLGREGEFWLSTVHGGQPGDEVDATGLLLERSDQVWAPWKVVRAQVLELGDGGTWSRRCNLAGATQVYVRVSSSGPLRVLAEGTKARVVVAPCFVGERPARYRPPEPRPVGEPWDVEAGLHVVTVTPATPGVAELVVVFGEGGAARRERGRGSIRFGNVAGRPDCVYSTFLAERPGVPTGLVLRRLPLDLRDDLPLTLAPGDSVSVAFEAREAGVVRCVAEDGTPRQVSVDSSAFGPEAAVAVGRHQVIVRGPRDGPETWCSLGLEVARLQPSTPLPALDPARLAAMPEFPVLHAGTPAFLDLGAPPASAVFRLRVPAPGLLRVESTGLLATRGTLRSRLVTSLASQEANGAGRNFLVQRELREGDYQLSVATVGRSRGHLGLQATLAPVDDGGELRPGNPARALLAPGRALSYRFTVDGPGPVSVSATGLGRTFRGTLLDSGGWPVRAPGGAASFVGSLDPGEYRLVVLPEGSELRCVALLAPGHAPSFTGHGPHALPLGTTAANVWREPAAGAPRAPDRWDFELQAPADVKVALGDEMRGRLVERRADGASGAPFALVLPRFGWRGRLPAGAWRLEAWSARRDDELAYEVTVTAEELTPGERREVAAPQTLAVSVGEAGTYELWSEGQDDVRAVLRSATGAVVAVEDDRPGDWGFLVARRLLPGTLTLEVLPAGGAEQAACTVGLRRVREVPGTPLAAGARREVGPGDDVAVLPLEVPADAELLLATAASGEALALAADELRSGAWVEAGVAVGREALLAVPLGARRSSWRLRLWSLDRRGGSADLSVHALCPRGALAAVAGATVPCSVACESLVPPGGVFEVAAGDRTPLVSFRPGLAASPADGALAVPADVARLWLVVPGAQPPAVRVQRLEIEPGEGRGLRVSLAEAPSSEAGTRRAAARVDLGASGPGPVVAWAEAEAGQPGLSLRPEGDAAEADGMAVGPNAAVAATLEPARAAFVWNASASGGPLEVKVRCRSFPKPRVQAAEDGAAALELPAGGAVTVELGEAVERRLALALEPRSLAVVERADGRTSVHAAFGAGATVEVEATAVRVTVLNGAARPARATVAALPRDPAARPWLLAPAAPFRWTFPAAGVARLAVGPGAGPGPWLLHVRGAVSGAAMVTPAGEVRRGRNLLEPPGEGFVDVEHGPGPVVAWMDPWDRAGAGLGWPPAPDAVRDVSAPSEVTLEGALVALSVAVPRPALLTVRTATPFVSLLDEGRRRASLSFHERGGEVCRYVTSGAQLLGLAPLGGEELSGVASVTALPLTTLGDGPGPEVLVPPGAARGFSFRATRVGVVGVGVRATPDTLSCTLLSERGWVLGRGVAQMPLLHPATYVLVLRAPADGPPVRARPSVVGLAVRSGPPAEVVRRYRQLGDAAAQAAGGDAE